MTGRRRASVVAGSSLLAMAALAGAGVGAGPGPVMLLALLAVCVLDVVAAAALVVVLSDRHRDLAVLSGAFRVAYAAVFAAVLAPLGAAEAGIGDHGQAWAAFDHAWTLSLVLFGPHLVLLALLVRRRSRIASAIAVLLAAAGGLYVLDAVRSLLLPGVDALAGAVEMGLVVTGVTGEVGLAVWLLVAGGRRTAAGSPAGRPEPVPAEP